MARLHLTREVDEPGTSFLIVGAHDVASLDEKSSDVDDETSPDDGDEDTRDIRRMHRRLVEALGRDFWAAMTGAGNRLPCWRSPSVPCETATWLWRRSRWILPTSNPRGRGPAGTL